VTLTSVDTLPAPSIPGNVFSASKVGAVYTLLSSGGPVSGQITYQGKALAEGAPLTLADGNRYQVSYRGGKAGHDVTLTRIANPATPGVAPAGGTPVVTGGGGGASGGGSGGQQPGQAFDFLIELLFLILLEQGAAGGA
jgi:hypothetical protein